MQSPTFDYRILLADDNESAATAFVQNMEAAGCHVRWVRNGLAALEALDSSIPDLALISLDLPEMNGFEVCEVMTQIPDLQHTVLAALMDSDSEEQRKLARAAGFHYYFTKPLDRKLISRLMGEDAMAEMPSGIVKDHSHHLCS